MRVVLGHESGPSLGILYLLCTSHVLGPKTPVLCCCPLPPPPVLFSALRAGAAGAGGGGAGHSAEPGHGLVSTVEGDSGTNWRTQKEGGQIKTLTDRALAGPKCVPLPPVVAPASRPEPD